MSKTLDAFAEEHPTSSGNRSYLDTLPEDIRKQLIASKAGHSTAERWLHEQGYDRATQQMLRVWRYKNGWTPT